MSKLGFRQLLTSIIPTPTDTRCGSHSVVLKQVHKYEQISIAGFSAGHNRDSRRDSRGGHSRNILRKDSLRNSLGRDARLFRKPPSPSTCVNTFHTSEHSCSGTLKESQHDHMVQWAKQFHYSCNEISQSNQTRNHPAKGCFENAEFKHAFITTSQKTVQSPKHTCDQQAATLSAQTI